MKSLQFAQVLIYILLWIWMRGSSGHISARVTVRVISADRVREGCLPRTWGLDMYGTIDRVVHKHGFGFIRAYDGAVAVFSAAWHCRRKASIWHPSNSPLPPTPLEAAPSTDTHPPFLISRFRLRLPLRFQGLQTRARHGP